MMIPLIIFWASVGLIVYTLVGFPLLLMLRGIVRPRRHTIDATITPSVSLIIAAHNEADTIEKKLQNIRELDYPADAFEAIIASDGVR